MNLEDEILKLKNEVIEYEEKIKQYDQLLVGTDYTRCTDNEMTNIDNAARSIRYYHERIKNIRSLIDDYYKNHVLKSTK